MLKFLCDENVQRNAKVTSSIERKIDGNRYKFIVKLINDDYFEVVAVRKQDNKRSSVTNLNTIIGEIIYPVLGVADMQDAFVNVDNVRVGRKLFDFAVKSISNTYWVSNHLENDLDEDFEMTA